MLPSEIAAGYPALLYAMSQANNVPNREQGEMQKKEEEGHLPRLRKLALALGFAQRPIEISDNLLSRQPSRARKQLRAENILFAFQWASLKLAFRRDKCAHRWP